MAQMNTVNYDALAWVQNEVQQSLADALQIVTRFIDAPQDVAVVEPCITQLHQVTGIMEMLGLQGALLLSQEMLSSATAIRSGQNANNEQLQDSLLKGLLLLPNYLNQIGPDVRDHPLRLIETINELRLSRNEQMISAESLFKPSLSVPLPNEVIPKPHQSALKSNISADKINHVFQVSLVNWIKTDDDSSLGKLSQLIHYLRLSCSHERNIILWWVSEGVIEALQQGGLAANTKIKLSLSKLNEPIKLLTKHDEQYLHSLFHTELVQQLLLLVAQATSSGSHVNLLKKVFSLDYFDPQLHQQIYSFTDNALTEARAGILEQIHEAKEQLNQFDNNDETAPSIVEQLVTQFASLASALSLISEQTASDLLLKQSNVLSTAHAGNALPDDDQLMSLADDLLRVENQLQHSNTVSVQQPHQDDQLQRTVIDGCLNELANIKETLILVDNNLSNSGDIISEVAMQLNLVAGSTAMLNLDSTASLLEATAEKMTICHDNGSGLNNKELGLFAEIISAIELYLEGLSQHGQRQTQLLDHAQYQLQNFEKLLSDESGIEHTVSQDNIEVQTPDLPFQEQVPAQTDTSVDRYIQQLETAAPVKTETSVDHYLQQLETAAQVRIESQAESELELADIELTVEHTNASTSQFAMGVDPDIAEVFIEEANEVMDELSTLIPQWKSNQDNNTLATIRRHYHTLKGSGRMAGADVIGELSWSVEESLNRVTDGNIASSPELEQLLTNSHKLIPELLTRFIHGNTSSIATVTELIDLAKQILNPAVEIEVVEPVDDEPDVPDHVDTELLQIFSDEAMQHLNTFKATLAEATSPFPIDKILLQASHSFKACANEAQVYVVANVSTTLDNYLQTFYNNDITLNETQLGKLNESIEGLTLLVDDATASRNNEQHVYDLLSKLNDMRPDLQLSEDQQGNIPEPAALEPVDDEPDVPDHVDTELLQIFSDEAMQHLNTFKATLAEATWPFRLDKTLLQASHSLKGCANVAQVYAVANVATTLDINLHNFYNNDIKLNETQLGKLNETIEGLTLLVDDAAASRNNEQQVYDLLSKLNDIQPRMQLAGVQQRIDPEILTAFLEETAELFEQYELLRHQLSQLPDDPDYKTALQQTLLKLDENADHAELPLLTELYQSLMQLMAEPDISENTLSTLLDMGSVQFTNIIESLVKNQDLPDISDFKGSVSTYFEQVETNISEQANDAIKLEADPDSVHSYMPEADEELLEAFTEECAELLESSGLAIKQWQKDPSNNEAAQQIQRDLHTLKGGARLTAITPLADLTHHTESLTLMASDNKCETDAEFFNLLQRCQDRLADMQEQFSRRSDIMLADDLITEIHHFSTQRDPESTAVDITQLIPTVSPPVENETTSSKTKSSTGGEQVRVKADLLDFLTNFAGEVSISRDRVSQQNTAMRQQLTEMESTVERLQEQLRKLEMETEAQILFRYEDQALQGRSEFDPLELDRFSQMQQLSRGLTESVTDLHDITHSIEDLVRESDTILLQQSRLSTDIQQGLMNTRLLPFNGLVPRLERIVRQTNTELDKQSELVVYGADRELDRTILDHIVAPIEHILRNAISHGIESQQERQQSEKNDVAQLTLTITRDGSEILITLSDDGRGIDVEKIRQKALANNLINPDKMPSDEELIQLILHSGFSTADDISQLAGRGVGMDVVNSEIRTLKGRLSIQSVKGQGTSFNIRLPLTLSVMQALLVGCAEEQYAIPLASVHAGERIAIKDIKTLLAQGDEARYEFNGVDYQFMALATLLNQPFNLQDDHAPQLPLLLFNSGEMQAALLVDSINSSREIVLKSVGEQLGHIAAISGATILGDGHVVFVLDIPTLVNTVDETMAADNLLDSALSTLHSIQNRLPLAMVVDDSITMRKASGNLLKRHGFEVITARDGIDAVALLNEQIPDVILLDVEMPRMDGFEFATLVRNDEQFSHLPIIMITSRTGEKHRSRARAIGVDAYLGKPYQEGELVDRLQSILGNKYPNPD